MRPLDAKPNADGSWTEHGRALRWPARLGMIPLGYDPGRRGAPRVPGFDYAQNRDRTHLVKHATRVPARERTLCGKDARYFLYTCNDADLCWRPPCATCVRIWKKGIR